MSAQLLARAIEFSHGPDTVLAGVDLTAGPGHRIGVVGPNGIGKSTLLRILAGHLEPTGGRVELHPPSATVALLEQELAPEPGETALDLLRRRTGVAAADAALARAADDLAAGSEGAGERYSEALDRWLRLEAPDFDAQAEQAVEDAGLPAAALARPAAVLSGGEQGRLGLAAVLRTRVDVLLLDEPTNDLDAAGLALLEEAVLRRTGPTVVVSHDRRFLSRVVTGVLEIDEHSRTGHFYDGGWDAYQAERAHARRLAEERYETYVEGRDRLRAREQRERQWAAQGVRDAKRKATDGDKFIRHFRAQTSQQLAARAARTARAAERLERVEKPWEGWDLRFSIAATERSGDLVAELAGAEVRRPGFTLGPVDLTVNHGERVSVGGPNGSGKTTLLAALLGDLDLDAGTSRQGPSVVVGRLAQARERFTGGGTLVDAFVAETGTDRTEARSTLAKFGLAAEHVQRPADQLSPGERTRAVLAAFQVQGVNLLVLDEPTNHLDLPAIEQLEQALDSFPGTLLLVTHDRAFLESVRLTRRIELAAGRVVRDEPAP